MNTALIVILILLLLACIALLTRSTKKKNEAIDRLLKEEQAIVEEERRMLSFLHDLGQAIAREDSQAAMYRLIVEGAMKVMESTGGALYLLDASERAIDDDDVVREIELGVINKHTMTERSMRYTESWHYDAEAKTWWQTSGLPDLWQGE